MTTNAIVVIDPHKAIEDAGNRRDIVVSLRTKNILREGVDFGIVPGTVKPTLLKPGAERLCAAFGFNPLFETIEKIERWDADQPLFFYRILCRLIHIESGMEVATGIGSCNSMEVKYRWRWVSESDVPAGLDKSKLLSRNSLISEFDFAIEKAETSGQYGKPASYWQQFKDAISNHTARETTRKTSKGKDLKAWEIGGLTYRIPNDDVFSLVNTVDKMACKRALVAAALIGANASEFFTQDVEDMPGFGVSADGEDVVEAVITEVYQASWADDAAQWNTFVKSAYDRFQINEQEVLGSLTIFDSEGAIPWRESKRWASAAIVAFACGYEKARIEEYTAKQQPADKWQALYEMAIQVAETVEPADAVGEADPFAL